MFHPLFTDQPIFWAWKLYTLLTLTCNSNGFVVLEKKFTPRGDAKEMPADFTVTHDFGKGTTTFAPMNEAAFELIKHAIDTWWHAPVYGPRSETDEDITWPCTYLFKQNKASNRA